jgi:hypothetical protein
MAYKDKGGRILEVGQFVDIPMFGMYTGKIVEIKESHIMVPGEPMHPPIVFIQLIVMAVAQNGLCEGVYAVKAPPGQEQAPPSPDSDGKPSALGRLLKIVT